MDLLQKILSLVFKLLLLFALVWTLTFSFSSAASLYNLSRLAKDWVRTDAKVASIEQQQDPLTGLTYAITLEYEADGKILQKSDVTRSPPSLTGGIPLQEGDTVPVFVNPNSPSEVVLPVKRMLLLYKIYLGLGLVLSFIIVLMLIPRNLMFKGRAKTPAPARTRNKNPSP